MQLSVQPSKVICIYSICTYIYIYVYVYIYICICIYIYIHIYIYIYHIPKHRCSYLYNHQKWKTGLTGPSSNMSSWKTPITNVAGQFVGRKHTIKPLSKLGCSLWYTQWHKIQALLSTLRLPYLENHIVDRKFLTKSLQDLVQKVPDLTERSYVSYQDQTPQVTQRKKSAIQGVGGYNMIQPLGAVKCWLFGEKKSSDCIYIYIIYIYLSQPPFILVIRSGQIIIYVIMFH